MLLSSSLPRVSTYENDIADSWPEQADGEVYGASEFYEPEKPSSKKNMKPEASYATEDKIRRFSGQTKLKDPIKIDHKISHPDDDLNALLKVGAVTKLVIYLYWLMLQIDLPLLSMPGRGRPCRCS